MYSKLKRNLVLITTCILSCTWHLEKIFPLELCGWCFKWLLQSAKNESKTRDLVLPAWFQVKSSLVVCSVSLVRTVSLGRWSSQVPLGGGVSGAFIPGRAKAFQLYPLESGKGKEVSYMKCFKGVSKQVHAFSPIWCFSNASLKYLLQESPFTLYLCAALISVDNSPLPPSAAQWRKKATRCHAVFTGLGGSSFMHLNGKQMWPSVFGHMSLRSLMDPVVHLKLVL